MHAMRFDEADTVAKAATLMRDLLSNEDERSGGDDKVFAGRVSASGAVREIVAALSRFDDPGARSHFPALGALANLTLLAPAGIEASFTTVLEGMKRARTELRALRDGSSETV